MKITPVILAGGYGKRLWPLSREYTPKQLIPLVTKKTMLQETILRISNNPDINSPIVICGSEHRFFVAEQLREIDVKPKAIILEPVGRNTAPAIALAANFLKESNNDSVMLVLPADHIIKNKNHFLYLIKIAAKYANKKNLITFGIDPSIPDTGYGYIQKGKIIESELVYEIKEFKEKPDLKTAKKFLAAKSYLWNSGMFAFKPSIYLEELKFFQPELYQIASRSFKQRYSDLDFLRIPEKNFLNCPSISIDYAVMEKTKKGIILKADLIWSDVGSWDSLSNISKKDSKNNTKVGDVFLYKTNNSYIRSTDKFVATIGLNNLIVVNTKDGILICNKNNSQDVSKVTDYLRNNDRSEQLHHKIVFRPWGSYESLIKEKNFQVKNLTIKKNSQTSLQVHKFRSEHWIVVKGKALITVNEKKEVLTKNQSIDIPIGSKHRIKNIGKTDLNIIEVQTGVYLEEDDIVRIEDSYGRAS
ncbi:MAG: mannose-1-phosphate guanylyltransferase/mannose-6-phosphate isomerase [Methylophilaceae bacterium]|nr:mannose-1-phosphate guanylyltransferase/mannose-6-phosphate isomerase [Methylophilaceae bacterium]